MISTTIIFDHKNRVKNDVGMLEIRCIINRKSYYISTGVRVSRANFVAGAVVNQADAEVLNNRLRIIYQRVQSDINECLLSGHDIDLVAIRRNAWAVAEDSDKDAAPFLDWIEKQVGMLRHKPGTMKHYTTLVSRLKEFNGLRKWSDLTVENIYDWDSWLHQLPARVKQNDTDAPEQISDGAVYNYHKCLKALLNRAVEFNKIDKSPYDRMKGKFKRGDRENVVYLTEDEMQAFMATTPPIGTEMDVAHDLFVFQMFTGLSYSDTQVFDMSSYKKVNGKWMHRGERVKTGVPYVSQLLSPAVAVLEKYNMTTPKIDNSKYNLCLKALGMVAGISTPLHSHVARHTFATYMLRNGAKIQNVSAMLGHTNIKQTQRYAKVMAMSVYDDFDMISDKIEKKQK